MRRVALVLAVLLTGSALVAGVAQADTPGRYVALGDSYSAGPLIPPQGGLPPGCLRSGQNFPSVVAAGIGAAEFVDVSCSGATTDDFTAPQNVVLGQAPPQFDALTGDEDLVTLTIGGNDIGFADIIQRCALTSPLNPLGAGCKDSYGTTLDERISVAGEKVATALAAIVSRAPDATVALVGYPALLPDEGPGCFPVVPFSPGDVAWLRGVEKSLNATLEAQADAAGVTFVDTYTPTIGHDMCQVPGVKWIEGLLPTAPAAPAHPNAQGMQAMGAAVLDTLTRAHLSA
ncbi:SGNH/GDSL hydrolase family protein [Pseudonocardia sp. WMMC193]|uniref:SGNH/GDSL hydrolase family protein n=1 Tax=Pseudonocardia sp. WMMC193 TaxID=2911965 RepID=UPI001F4298AC|nr:SGNH/GDSL hydrolase family protein [Pseudonocardia sp. WMMC193]MCF7549001.1 SGNH/GDSL hydrolase family protein [Pseudonocardia sp. WMMC193]